MLRESDIQNSRAIPFSWPNLTMSLTNILFAPSRTLWAMTEILLLMTFFLAFSWCSPYLNWAEIDSNIVLLTVSFGVIFVVLSVGLGQYERARRSSVTKIFFNSFFATAIAITFSLSITYFTAYGTFGRLNLLWGSAGASIGIIAFRLSIAFMFRRFPYRFTTLGTSELIGNITDFLKKPSTKEAKYVKYIESPGSSEEEDVLRFLDQEKIHDVIIAESTLRIALNHRLLLKILEKRIRILHEEHFYSEFFECSPINRLDASKFLNRDLKVRSILYESVKRLFDIGASTMALMALSPFLLLIAAAIRVDTRGKALFHQPRQGRFQQPFMMYKFRTMHEDQSCPAASGGFTQKLDARITRIGRFLRPLHIDELPQLWNILKGDMSIVGPRPEALVFAQRMSREIDLYDFRYSVRPGLTGHAQLMVGYMLDNVDDTRKKLAYDLYYIANKSLLLDIRIILRTAFIVAKKTYESLSVGRRGC
ncbi:exopolysaccharide biosynthesis polyprenyl glycosylphosphotransferase [Oligoflexus tunisiensis]|uniref:exopolysaccharide biosynthesis polyprenyl glycosylphosphotransferase n=1 Tax=Oligoflexus tunisiensis TaxID=708132 RepID=UPI00114D072C|nr:exopolysaccharide biosynthesis polyprenyl glycosylphosphotransferase [Oligoflexus tunisiensis]